MRNILLIEEWNHYIPTGASWLGGLQRCNTWARHLSPKDIPTQLINDSKSPVDIIICFDANKTIPAYSNYFYNILLDNSNIKLIAIIDKWYDCLLKYLNIIDYFVMLYTYNPQLQYQLSAVGKKLISVPLAANPEIFNWWGVEESDKPADYSFIGGNSHGYKNEDKYLLPLMNDNNLRGIVGGIYGQPPISYTALNKIYNLTKINVNFHYSIQKSIDGRQDLNGRTFEIAMSGNFQLADDHPLIREYFGDSIPTIPADSYYDTFYEYLRKPDERVSKAQQARKICLDNHTWQKRMQDFLWAIEK